MTQPSEFPVLDLQGPNTVELTLEQRYELMHNVFKHFFFGVYRHIGERYGWDVANDIAAAVSDEATPIIAEAFRHKFELEAEGAALVSQVMQAEFQGEGSDVAVLAETEDEADLDIRCAMGAAIRRPRFAIPIVDGLCERGCRLWGADVARSVDPELRVERLTWMGDGADRCRYRITRGPVTGGP